MEQQQQPQSRRGRRRKVEPEAQPECPLPQPECPLPSSKKDDLPPGTRRKKLPSGGYMIIKDNFKKAKGSY
jgi:hypothetical protein